MQIRNIEEKLSQELKPEEFRNVIQEKYSFRKRGHESFCVCIF